MIGSLLAVVLGLALIGWALTWRSLVGARRSASLLADQLAAMSAPRVEERQTTLAEKTVKRVIETAVRVRDAGVTGMLMSSIDDLSRWAMEDHSEIAALAAEDGSVTLLFTDIEGSTALNAELGDEAFVRMLIAHDALVRARVDRRHGHIVKGQGDGFMVAFPTPVDAVRAALGIQRDLGATTRLRRNLPRVRIGIHTGPVVLRDGDFFGTTVALAARVAARATGGQTLVTEEMRTALAGNERLSFTEAETVELKGFPGEHTLYAVSSRLPPVSRTLTR